jgi:AcrR family transcriptional regulator
MATHAAARTPRRSTEQVRQRIIDAAARQFATVGWSETTTRSVAAEADISGSVLHRHFPTKEQLFAAALVAPFLAFFDEFANVWSKQVDNPWADERLVREFVADLYRNVAVHQTTLATLLVAGNDFEAQLRDDVRQGLDAGLKKLQTIGEHEANTRGWFSADVVQYTNVLVMSLVTGVALMKPWLAQLDQDDDVLIDLIARLTLHGIRLETAGKPDSQGTQGRGGPQS